MQTIHNTNLSKERDISRFFIFSTARSGSSYLVYWLNMQKNLRCHGEVFIRNRNNADNFMTISTNNLANSFWYHLNFNKYVSAKNGLFGRKICENFIHNLYENRDFPDAFAELEDKQLTKKNQNFSNEKAVGFKLMDEHLSYFPYVLDSLKKQNAKAIFLHRENLLEQAVSWFQMRQSRIAHSVNGEKAEKIKIEKSALLSKLEEIKNQHFRQEAYLKNFNHIKISYDEMIENPKMTAQKIEDLIEVGIDASVKPILTKRGNARMQDSIANFGEISEYLKGSQFEKYL